MQHGARHAMEGLKQAEQKEREKRLLRTSSYRTSYGRDCRPTGTSYFGKSHGLSARIRRQTAESVDSENK